MHWTILMQGRLAQTPSGGQSRVAITARLSMLATCLLLLAAPTNSLATGSSALSWGENYHTELAAGFESHFEESPVSVLVNKITSIATGKLFTVALLENGTIASWGLDEKGQLGNGRKGDGENGGGTFETGQTDFTVLEAEHEGEWSEKPLEEVQTITASGEHAMALLKDGKVVAWGDNEWGQLGNGKGGFERITHEVTYVPKEVIGKEGLGKLEGVVLIASSGEDNFAVTDEGKAMMAWGGNKHGQLGIGELGPEKCIGSQGELNGEGEHEEPCSTYPRPVKFPTALKEELKEGATITAVSAFADSTFILLSNGEVWSWGFNGQGQLGTGGSTKSPEDLVIEPQQVKNLGSAEGDLGPAVAIAAGNDHALALLEDGEVVSWGDDEDGELGQEASEKCANEVACFKTPRKVEGLEHVTTIAAGLQDSFVLIGGKVYSFGKDSDGELGNGTHTEAADDIPAAIPGLEHVSAISAGNLHTNALLESGYSVPTALLKLAVDVESLKLGWTFSASEFQLRIAVFEQEHLRAPRYGSIIKVSSTEHKSNYESHEYSFTDLTSEPHVIRVQTGEKTRLLVATPEP